MKYIAAILILMCCADANAENLLIAHYNGTFQLIKNLSHHQCEFLRHRALRQPATQKEIKAAEQAREERKKSEAEQRRQMDLKCKDKSPIVERALNDAYFTCKNGKASDIYWVGEGEFETLSATDPKTAECFE